jgi:membrane fusion protein, multidrug efflux system
MSRSSLNPTLMPSSSSAFRVGALLAGAAALLALGACGHAKAPPPKAAVPVGIGAAHLASVPYTISANGVVTPIQTAAVTSQVDGIITDVAFAEGHDVAKGDVLFRIEPRLYSAAYQEARAALTRDSATADNARMEAERYATLVAQDYVTKEQADQQTATARAAAATVESDRAALGAAQFNLENTTIRAPIAGRTGSVLVRVGNVVHGAASTPLVVIQPIRPILVRFAVAGTDLPLIRQYSAKGTLPIIAAPGSATSQATPDTAGGDSAATGPAPGGDDPPPNPALKVSSAPGTLTFIDNAIDTTTGTVMLKATCANGDGALWPGEFVAVSLKLFDEANALVVPSTAVMTGQQGTYVYAVDSSGVAQQRRVAVERSADGLSIIASGLKNGEHVVTEGQSRVTPGAHVTTSGPNGAKGTDAPSASAPGAKAGSKRGHG